MLQEVLRARPQRAIAMLRLSKRSLQLRARRLMQHGPLPQGCLPLGSAPWTMPSSQSWTASSRMTCALSTVPAVCLVLRLGYCWQSSHLTGKRVCLSCNPSYSFQPRDVAEKCAIILAWLKVGRAVPHPDR